MVTHEHDVIQYVRRVVELRDGKVIRDDEQEPRSAAADLAMLIATQNESETGEHVDSKENNLVDSE